MNLRPSSISSNHKIIKTANTIGIESYGSPTLSDQALLDFPSVKIGPGNSKRSHSADEYIYVDEIEEGVAPENIDGTGLDGLKAQIVLEAAVQSIIHEKVVRTDDILKI